MKNPRLPLLIVIALASLAWGAAPASAQAPEFLTRFSTNGGIPGSGAGELNNPRAIAANPTTGHVYVSENASRVSEFTAWGEFVRAWGGGVAAGNAQGTGDLSEGSNLIHSLTTASGAFLIGHTVTGDGIPAGTTITAIGAGRMTLSKPATASGAGVALSVAEATGNVPTDELQTVTIGGAPSGGSFTLTTTSGRAGGTVREGSNEFATSPRFFTGETLHTLHVGDEISGTAFPAGTTITAIDTATGTLTLSAAATCCSGNATLTATETTAPIAHDAPASGPGSVQEALEALPNVGSGGVSVSGPAAGPYEITFQGPLLGDLDVPEIGADGSALTPSGTVAVATERQGASAAEICAGAECKGGIAGSGRGQFDGPAGMAVDAAGDVYVYDRVNRSVQKFDSAGNFLLMFGGQVNKTKVDAAAPAAEQNVCPVDPGDVCQAGSAGTDPSYLPNTIRDVIAYSPAENAIIVGDTDRIQKFNPDGTYREQIDFAGDLAAFDGESVSGLDVDSAGNIYFSLAGLDDVYKTSPAGTPLAPGMPGASAFEVAGFRGPVGLAVDTEGSVYAIVESPKENISPQVAVLKYDSAGNLLVPTPAESETQDWFPYIPFTPGGFPLIALSTNLCPGSDSPGNLYIAAFKSGSDSWVDAYGSPPLGCEPPPPNPPAIEQQYATSVTTDSATLQAQINPRFWPDTTYQVQWGTSPCSSGGCTNSAPAPPALLTNRHTSSTLKTGAVALQGLQPGTTYHYRFVSQSGGGGPTLGAERAFRTFNAPEPKAPCANDGFRAGPGALLPDCRAYEMVSPADKAGGEAAPWKGGRAKFPQTVELYKSAASGQRFTYSAFRAFAEPQSSPWVSQYLARRSAAGWRSEALSPPITQLTVPTTTAFSREFEAFSEDLCHAWLVSHSQAPLAEGAIAGYSNLYRRESCGGAPLFEALTVAEPPNRDPRDYRLESQGASADGSHGLFTANDKLHPDAPLPPDEFDDQLYEHTPQGLRFVCYLPDESPSPHPCGAGSRAGSAIGSLRNAISADGERIFWTASPGGLGGQNAAPPGQIYARVGGAQTIAISEEIGAESAWYWTAAEDGTRAIFSFDIDRSGAHGGELYSFDLDAALAGDPDPANLIAAGVLGPMGASEDARRIYFASTEDLDSGGAGTAGERNLYLYDAAADSFTHVMELAAEDVGGTFADLAPIDEQALERSASVTADGLHATFSAVAPPPSGYDNTHTESGLPAQEVYRYDAGADQLSCVSCNPSGARPAAVNLPGAERGASPAAAKIQGWETLQGHSLRPITADGQRIFFESHEALVSRDTNETWDVYQWEVPGSGTCTSADPTYGEASGGCVDLISSGQSPHKSTFLDADPTGENVFIGSRSSLVAADTDSGLSDVYVARVGGGFPEPPPPPAPCEGEGCRGASPEEPGDLGAGTAAFRGPGNPAAGPGCGRFARAAKRGSRQAKRLRSRAAKLRRAARRSSGPGASRTAHRRAKRLAKGARKRARAARRTAKRARRCRAGNSGRRTRR